MFSIIICCTMLAGIMAANAASSEYTDSSAIVNKTAVKAVTDLGIMSAKDGKFEPTGKLTRAEMCKILCLILNGGRDPVLGAEIIRIPFSDIKDHWAVGYISYCMNLGAVSGNGDNTFDPDSYITGAQAAKMLLVAIGYRAKEERMVGSDWALNAMVKANQKELFKGLNINVSEEISRDNAAQIINNALNAVMVEYDMILYMENGELKGTPYTKNNEKGNTLLSRYFKI